MQWPIFHDLEMPILHVCKGNFSFCIHLSHHKSWDIQIPLWDSFLLVAGEAHGAKIPANLGQLWTYPRAALSLILTILLNSNTFLLRMPQDQRPCLIQVWSTSTVQMLSEWMNEWMEQPPLAAESWILSIPFSAFPPLLLVAIVHAHTWLCTVCTLSPSSQQLKNWGLPLLGASFNVHEMNCLFMD